MFAVRMRRVANSSLFVLQDSPSEVRAALLSMQFTEDGSDTDFEFHDADVEVFLTNNTVTAG